MKPVELPEVQSYLTLVEESDGCDALFRAEVEALDELNLKAEGVDWADTAGTDELHDYWLAADTAKRQAHLGMICHMRAQAWHAIWRKFLK
ncbi:hypothetical protein [Marivita geojedonensis]|uniref:Uncharacterized protein n=1 Tax=Marivita geojedonensis TaxID=1123756 RepID=A0A1X4NP26_9RHOB|nr:hypothetical protein [Marivita geojedonensis]OSQ52472.1 hypothetical protein MGEO_03565 [Marivita geojedonensis]PRY80647.1 hypothetical protein CLV76_1039 [Marivita geojedonensis]